MYFESVFIKPNKFYISIYDNKLLKKFTKIAFFEHLNQNDPLTIHRALVFIYYFTLH